MIFKITLEILATLLFTSIFGVLYDYTYSFRQSITERKIYLMSLKGIISQLFLRTIIIVLFYIPNFFTLKSIRYLRMFLEVSIFALCIFALVHIKTNDLNFIFSFTLKNNFLILYIYCFFVWSIVYAWIAITSKYFYLGKSVSDLSNLELKMLYSSATLYDKIKLFLFNVTLSITHTFILILSLITAGYVYLTAYLINLI
jgi:hypothetical protein